MDNFLIDLYEEEKTKIAAKNMESLFDSMSVDDLENFLGVKIAGDMSKGPVKARDAFPERGPEGRANRMEHRKKNLDTFKECPRLPQGGGGGSLPVRDYMRAKKASLANAPAQPPEPAGVKGLKVYDRGARRLKLGLRVQKEAEDRADADREK
jgi:hypothetical protein